MTTRASHVGRRSARARGSSSRRACSPRRAGRAGPFITFGNTATGCAWRVQASHRRRSSRASLRRPPAKARALWSRHGRHSGRS
jgi:hypothetical protein